MENKGGVLLVQKLSNLSAQYLISQNIINSEDKETYRYGLEVLISDCVDILLLLIIGLLQHKIIDCFIYYLSFGLIRKFSGGYHFNHYYSCIGIHVLIFLIYTFIDIPYGFCMTLGIVSSGVIILLSPIENINRKVAEGDIIKYKRIILPIILIHLLLMSIINVTAQVISYILFVVSLLMIICIKLKWKK